MPLIAAGERRLPRPLSILPRIDSVGQAPSVGPEPDLVPSVETFVARVSALTDEDRVVVANARRVVDEAFHEKALRAGFEALADRGEEYLEARRALVSAHLPARLDLAREDMQSEELAHWNDVARLVQQALDDALIAILTSASLHPNHLRELYRSLQAGASAAD